MYSKKLKLLLLLPLCYTSGAFSTSIEEFLICQYEQRCDALGDLASDIKISGHSNNLDTADSNLLYSYKNTLFSKNKATDFSQVKKVYLMLANDQKVDTSAVKEAIQILEDDLETRRSLLSYARDEVKDVDTKENGEIEYVARELSYLKQLYGSATERKTLLEQLSNGQENKFKLDNEEFTEIKNTIKVLTTVLDSLQEKVDMIVRHIEKDIDSETDLVKYLSMYYENVE
ncbi:hypothetical protein ACNZ70_001709 [Vibrio mimicus]